MSAEVGPTYEVDSATRTTRLTLSVCDVPTMQIKGVEVCPQWVSLVWQDGQLSDVRVGGGKLLRSGRPGALSLSTRLYDPKIRDEFPGLHFYPGWVAALVAAVKEPAVSPAPDGETVHQALRNMGVEMRTGGKRPGPEGGSL